MENPECRQQRSVVAKSSLRRPLDRRSWMRARRKASESFRVSCEVDPNDWTEKGLVEGVIWRWRSEGGGPGEGDCAARLATVLVGESPIGRRFQMLP
jgi:hypothetical protein